MRRTKRDLLEMLRDYILEDYNDNLIEYACVNGRRKEVEELEQERDSILEDIQTILEDIQTELRKEE